MVPRREGVVSVTFLPGAVHDLAGNPSLPSANLSFVFDAVTPLVNLTTRTRPVTNTVEVFTLSFTEAPFQLSNASFSCGNCSVVSVARLGPAPNTTYEDVFAGNPPVVYNVTLVPTTPEGVVSLQLPEGAVHDRARNGNAASPHIQFYYDSVLPTVVLTSATPLNGDQYNLQPVLLLLSERVVALTPRHLKPTRCDVRSVVPANGSTSGLEWVVTIEPWLPGPAILTEVKLEVSAAALYDPAGNPNVLSFLDAVNETVRACVHVSAQGWM